MPTSLPTRVLREHPDLNQLKRQARELLESFRAGDPATIAEVQAHVSGSDRSAFALHDAQLTLARAYGFASWPKLKAYVNGVTVAQVIRAIETGDGALARSMLHSRPELARMNVSEDDERTALHYAVLARNADLVRLLVRHGADPRGGVHPHRDATTPLILAEERGDTGMVELLKEEERRSGRTLRSDPGVPPIPADIMRAAEQGDEDSLIRVLEEHPFLLHVNFQHPLMTPLHSAVAMLWDRVALWLIDHGADVNARVDGGPSPLEVVGCGGWPKNPTPGHIAAIVAMLRERGAELTARAAVTCGDVEWLRARHAEGRLANGLPRNQGYRGLLEMAATADQPRVLEALLELGFDPDEVLPMGDTGQERRGGPMAACVRHGRTAMAATLLRHGATVTARAAVLLRNGEWLRREHAAGRLENPIGAGGGLLSLAVQHDLADMLVVLLDLGLDPDERVRVEDVDEIAYSSGGALHHCASTGKLALAEMLLKAGANPNLHVYSAGPPIYQALQSRDGAMAALLERHGAVVDASTAGLLRLGDRARKLLEDDATGGSAPDTHAPHRSVAAELLFYACDAGDPDIVQMALDRLPWPPEDPRWHVMLVRNLGDHPEPDRRRHVDCFRRVLGRCEPDVPGQFGRTILHDLAANWCAPGADERVELASLVLDRQPRLDVRDDLLRSTPLGWACRWGRPELVRLLLERGADPIEAEAEPWARPLAWSEKGHREDIVALLRKRGA